MHLMINHIITPSALSRSYNYNFSIASIFFTFDKEKPEDFPMMQKKQQKKQSPKTGDSFHKLHMIT